MAWQFVMSNVDGTLTEGETYTISVDFEGEAEDYLDLISFAIEWDTALLELTDFPDLAEYTRGSGFTEYTLWGESAIPSVPDTENGRWYDISSETDLDHMGEFFPEDTGETHMVTLTFTALQSGYFDELASFYFTPENDLTELVDINGSTYTAENGQLQFYKDGNRSILAPLLFIVEEIAAQSANIETQSDPIPLIFTPTSDTAVTFSAASSNTDIVTAGQVQFAADEAGTALTEPFEVETGVETTVYIFITPEADAQGTAAITVTLSGDGGEVGTSFDLTIELAEATLNAYGGTTTYRNSSPVTLRGEKGRGSIILLKIGDDAPMEIVAADVDGDWEYDWGIPADGSYEFTLINRAGTVEDAFATGTMVMDTVPPQVPITERVLTYVTSWLPGSGPGGHNIGIRAVSPECADSSQFNLCLDGVKQNYTKKDYGETHSFSPKIDDGVIHQATAIPVDLAGNEQIDCTGNPVAWMFSDNSTEIGSITIALVEPDQGSAYVEIQWPVYGDPVTIDDEVRVWAKSLVEDDWEELSGSAVQDGDWWGFEDHTSPARIRCYKLTDAAGLVTLVEFLLYDLYDHMPDATLNSYGGTTTRVDTSPVTLSGNKERGNRILLQIGSSDPFEIVASDVIGAWAYEWNLPGDGTYDFSLINMAGAMEEVFASGTIILGTSPPPTCIAPILMLLLEDE